MALGLAIRDASRLCPLQRLSRREAAPASAPIGGASAPSAPAATPTSAAAPAPVAEASKSEPATQAPAPASAPASAPVAETSPAAQASTSEGLGPEPAAGVAPESLAQLAGAWTRSAADCNKLFQRRGSAVAYRQPVDQFAQAAIIESQRIRLPTSICRLERVSRRRRAQGKRRVSRSD
jgi:hypothetical protein